MFEQVSKPAWADWLRHQTMLINENRLSPIDPKTRKFLEEQMETVFLRRRRGTARGLCAATDLTQST